MIKENKIYSRAINNLLLHKVIFFSDSPVEKFNRINLSEDEEFIQVAYIEMNNNHTFEPHQHIFKDSKSKTVIAQESWVIIKGKVKVNYYDIDGQHLGAFILNAGDITITFRGGHNYTALEQDTIVYEIKTGPYDGVDSDKIRYSSPKWPEYKDNIVKSYWRKHSE